jgi:lipopolysaccharide transport system ATP-binding protein
MRRAEIQRRFDDIVEFSGVRQFIDTPVKRYSSGMYVRLAFAVAAHLEPEILLVDEVLAVGDAEFQKKCLGKMQSVVHEGRTVLFVSHNMAAIKALCPRALLFDGGRLVADGPVDAVVDRYLQFGQSAKPGGEIPDAVPRTGTGEARVRDVRLLDQTGAAQTGDLYLGQPLRVAVGFEAMGRIADAVIEIGVSTVDGTRVVSAFSVDGNGPPLDLAAGRHRLQLDIATVLLPRTYTVDVAMHHAAQGRTIDFVERAMDFTVLNVSAQGGDTHLPSVARGFVRPESRWSFGAAAQDSAR